MKKQLIHYVVATVIIRKFDRFLIVRRSQKEKIMPGLWSFPGGILELTDYINKPKNTTVHWHNVLDHLIMRECYEELNLNIRNIEYLKNLIFVRPDGVPTLVVSFMADYDGGQVKLNDELDQYAWVKIHEAKRYNLIEGIYDELIAAFNNCRNKPYQILDIQTDRV